MKESVFRSWSTRIEKVFPLFQFLYLFFYTISIEWGVLQQFSTSSSFANIVFTDPSFMVISRILHETSQSFTSGPLRSMSLGIWKVLDPWYFTTSFLPVDFLPVDFFLVTPISFSSLSCSFSRVARVFFNSAICASSEFILDYLWSTMFWILPETKQSVFGSWDPYPQ